MNDSFSFSVNEKKKKKIYSREILHCKSYYSLNVISGVVFLSGIAMIVWSGYKALNDPFFTEAFSFITFGIILIVFAGLALYIQSVMHNRFMQERYFEEIWVDGGYLYHYLRKAIWMPKGRVIDRYEFPPDAYQFVIDIASIRNAKYDPKSRRMEFNGSIKCIYYDDYIQNSIQGEHSLSDTYFHYLYDFTEPSLYEYLTTCGVKFELCTIEFDITDKRP